MQVVMSVVAFKPGLGMYSGAVFQCAPVPNAARAINT
jgi:hypothetical protein